jgi:hypothetical protein
VVELKVHIHVNGAQSDALQDTASIEGVLMHSSVVGGLGRMQITKRGSRLIAQLGTATATLVLDLQNEQQRQKTKRQKDKKTKAKQ